MTPSNGQVAARTEQVARYYRMGATTVRAVDNVTLTIPNGEFVALLGSSGSGKSTLLNLLAGLDRPTLGAILVHERNLAAMSSSDLAKHRSHTIGIVFQAFNLLPRMTLEENVELPLRLAEVDRADRTARVREAIERVHLGTRLSHRPSELSGGEQQRAALARALVNRPTILLADEPTGNLDSVTGDEIMNLLREINESGVTIIMVTHEQDRAETFAHRLIHMKDGKVVSDGAPRLKARDLTELAARNLQEALLRNSLTTLGIAVGVASLVAMLSLGVGLQDLANDRLAHSGLFNAIFVSPRVNLRGFLRRPAENAPPPVPAQPLDDGARARIAALPNVVEVYPEIRFPTEIHFEANSYPTVVAGVQESARSGGAFDGMKGSYFSGPAADEAILQVEFARQLSDSPDSLIGKEIVLRYAERQALPPEPAAKNSPDASSEKAPGESSGGFSIVPHEERLHIVGIVETDPALGFGGLGNGGVLIPLQLAEKLRATQATDLRQLLRDTPAKHTYENLTVRVTGASQAQAVEDAIKQMGFGAFSLLDATNNLRLIFAVFDLLLGIFGSLALVVASLGIINTLVMAILERRREIGVLKALGAADRDVRRLFLVEAGSMGILGGVFGVLLGWLIGQGINLGTKVYLTRHHLPIITVSAVPWWMVAAAIAFSIATSLAAGIYPAARAARLDPVEALRYE